MAQSMFVYKTPLNSPTSHPSFELAGLVREGGMASTCMQRNSKVACATLVRLVKLGYTCSLAIQKPYARFEHTRLLQAVLNSLRMPGGSRSHVRRNCQLLRIEQVRKVVGQDPSP